MFFNKKEKNKVDLFSVCNGTLKEITEVSDPVFSEKMMGDGFAVVPSDGEVVSPVEGTIATVFPTLHAISIESKDNLEIIVHMGIDTVALGGEGFTVYVKEGDHVQLGQKLAEMDLSSLAEKEKVTDVVVVLTNLDSNKRVVLNTSGMVKKASHIGAIQKV